MPDDRVRGGSLIRALHLHALANEYRSRASVQADPNKKAELLALGDYWEAKAKEAEAEAPKDQAV